MLHLTFTVYALFIALSLLKIYQTRTFPKGNRQDLPTVFTGISKITKNNNKINHIDLSFNITTPSFNFTFSQIKFVPLFSNASNPLYSQEVISLSNHTIAFFFDLIITSLNVHTNPHRNAQLTFKSVYGEKKYFKIEFILNSDGTLKQYLLPNKEDILYIHYPNILDVLSKSNEIKTYLHQSSLAQMSQNFHEKLETYFDTLFKIYPVSDAEACLRSNIKLILLKDFFDASFQYGEKYISKVKIHNYIYDNINKERVDKMKDSYIIFKNITLNVIYKVEEDNVINEENGKVVIKELKYGANMFDYSLDLDETDVPGGLPQVILVQFKRSYEELLISDENEY
jgi:hypothetical protein